MQSTLRIAVEGCCHGELNQIYDRIIDTPEDLKPELLIICGDFQSLRNTDDLNSLAVPEKYKQLGDFHEYFNGTRTAPILTVFVGGNHEASNYLCDLQNGGWVCKNIFFMGYSNVIWYKGLRIGGISGIYKQHNFYKPHYEKFPLNDKTVRSIYHTRFEDYLKLYMINDLNINCMISHDWPEGIVQYGDLVQLLRRKPFFKADIEKGELGSVPSRELLQRLKPHYWFSAHLHTKFEASVQHDDDDSHDDANAKRKLSIDEDSVKKPKINTDEIDLSIESEDEEQNADQPQNGEEIELDLSADDNDNDDIRKETPQEKVLSKGFSQTNFLALDKCLPRRQFIEFLEIPITNEHESIGKEGLFYDSEFIKIKKWFKNFKTTETYKELRIEDINQSFIDQFKKDIEHVKLGTSDLSIPNIFESQLSNSEFQKTEYLKRFGL